MAPPATEPTARRSWPVATLVLVLTCLGVFAISQQFRDQQKQRQDEALEYYLQHPELIPDPQLVEANRLAVQLVQDMSSTSVDGAAPGADRQARLDRLTALWKESRNAHPQRRWGLIPADFAIYRLATYPLLHSSWWQLALNLIFLYLASAPLEQRWGTAFSLVFFFGAAAFSGLVVTTRYPQMESAIVGAEGVVSALVGALALRFWRHPPRYGTALGYPRPGYGVALPSWLIVPVWVATQIFPILPSGDNQPHNPLTGPVLLLDLSGLGFGLFIGALTVALSLERSSALTSHSTYVPDSDPELEDALEAIEAGKLERARLLLLRTLRQHPSHREAALALWDVGSRLGRIDEATPSFLRCIWEELRNGEIDLALRHYDELQSQSPQAMIDHKVKIGLLEAFVTRERIADAAQIAVRLEDDFEFLTPALLARLARATEGLSPRLSRRAARVAADDPSLPQPARSELETLIARLPEAEPGLTVSSLLAQRRREAALVEEEPAATEDPPILTDPEPTMWQEPTLQGRAQQERPLANGDVPVATPEPQVEPEPDAAPEPQVEPEGELALEAEPQAEPEPEPETQPEPLVGAAGEPGAGPGPELASPPGDPPTDEALVEAALVDSAPEPPPGEPQGDLPEDSPIGAAERASDWAQTQIYTPDYLRRAVTPDPAAAPPEAAQPQSDIPALRVVDAFPIGLEEDAIIVSQPRGKTVRWALREIACLGAARIEPIQGAAHYLLDLFVDAPQSQREELRIVRCATLRFDPRHLIRGEINFNRAFAKLVARLAASSGCAIVPAEPLPDTERPFMPLESIEEYEDSVRERLRNLRWLSRDD